MTYVEAYFGEKKKPSGKRKPNNIKRAEERRISIVRKTIRPKW